MTLLTFTQHIPNIVGYAASICMVLGYLPQLIHTLRTRKTDDIAVGTFLLMAIGGFFFMIQGLLLENWPLFLCNLCTTTMSAIIFAIKMSNDWKKKKQQQQSS
jgi:MtN3 and saliva related transmembrane protein